jgi:alkylation response protein AidB-like acyl-CoA dehydrogenase
VRFEFTDEHDMFRNTVRDLFADRCPPDAVRASWETTDARVPDLWGALAEIGVLAALAPEEAGGLGMDEVAFVRILEEVGYAAVPEPLMEHAFVAIPALAEARSDALDSAIAGSTTITIDIDGSGTVASAAIADAIVTRVDDGLAFTTQYDTTALTTIDQSRRLAAVKGGVTVGLDGADAVLAYDRAVLGAAAQCIGIARRLLDATVAYVGDRQQFGKPVGSYQAVKHHLADVRIAVEFAAPLVYRAAWSVAHPETHEPLARARDVSMAKAQASDAVDLAARKALQCHGAIGYTFEYDLQLWLKRAWALSAAYGDARRHRDRVATAIGLA